MAEPEFMQVDLEDESADEASDEKEMEEDAAETGDVGIVGRANNEKLHLINSLIMCMTAFSAVFLIVENMLSSNMLEASSIDQDEEEDWMRVQAQDSTLNYSRQNLFFGLLCLKELHVPIVPRQLQQEWYIKPRSSQWFLFFLDFTPREDPERFREFFRIGPDLFYHIVDIVRDDMSTEPPDSLQILPNRLLTVERKVALAIRRLSTGDSFLGLAELFGLSKASVVRSTWKFIQTLVRRAEARYLAWPSANRMQQVKQRFWEEWGFPNCCGCIDGTHIPIELPVGEDPKDYFDYKHNMSISVQAIVDTDLRFLDIFAGWPGSVQDTRLLRKSGFYRHVVYLQDKLNGPSHRTRTGDIVREYLLGDAGYPSWDWIITPYARGVSPEKDDWNEIHSQTRMCVERAFGRLKGTWRILARILWKPTINRLSKTVAACAIMHNMIIDRREYLAPAVYAEFNAHPIGYNSLIRPTREWHEGGPEARNAFFHDIMRV